LNVLVTTEERFVQTPDGAVWSGGSGVYSFWLRYLSVFDSVHVLARVVQAETPPGRWQRANGENVDFCKLPHFVGIGEQLRHFASIRAAVKRAIKNDDAIILRVFSVIAPYVLGQLRAGRPFGVELVGDPYEVFGPSADPYPLRPFLRQWFTDQQKRLCMKACAVAYVTDHELKERYPNQRDAFATTYSSIELNDDSFVATPRRWQNDHRPLRLVSIGSLERLYKGFDVLIEALTHCKQAGLNFSLRIIGEGRCRNDLQKLAERLSLGQQVSFTGRIPSGHSIREQLDTSDIFVLASRTEGLPRAMLEAMARALPCIGTNVGGIPELLSPTEMVPRGDASALAKKILEVASSPARMTKVSAQNLDKSRRYHAATLSARRDQLYQVVRSRTEQWNLQHHRKTGKDFSSSLATTRSSQ
jgi:glycosyltransferase involved in cell wall biosynthesis